MTYSRCKLPRRQTFYKFRHWDSLFSSPAFLPLVIITQKLDESSIKILRGDQATSFALAVATPKTLGFRTGTVIMRRVQSNAFAFRLDVIEQIAANRPRRVRSKSSRDVPCVRLVFPLLFEPAVAIAATVETLPRRGGRQTACRSRVRQLI
ncbi:MAG: hypothetical protein KF847_20220 [Pirellulales bacterium]|nr:hypothetical protein [Pirellulales bacterium]